MKLTDTEIEILLDVTSTHIVRAEDGQPVAQDWTAGDVESVMQSLCREVEDRRDPGCASAFANQIDLFDINNL